MKLTDNISITADKNKKILTIKIDYSKVIDYTKKANKEVYANAYYKQLDKNFTLNLSLLGKKVAKKPADMDINEEPEEFGM